MAEIKLKIWNGKKVKEEILIERGNLPEVIAFLAYYKAEEYLHTYGFNSGSMDGTNPIGFIKGDYNLPEKWHNMDRYDKIKLDGIMISTSFRTSDVTIIFFDNE